MRAWIGVRVAGRFVAMGMAAIVFAASLGTDAMAKTVALVDNSFNDAFLNCGEGWVRASGVPDANIQVGGNFTTGLGNLVNGDELIIVAHSTGPGNFVWGGTAYPDFGAGGGKMPVPDGFSKLKNIVVQFVTCFSATAPDSGKSILDKFLAAIGGAGNSDTGSGFKGTATTHAVTSMSNGTDEQYAAAQACTDAGGKAWIKNPPANRPDTGGDTEPANQRSAGQALIEGCTGVPKKTLTFNLPDRIGDVGLKTGYAQPTDDGASATAPASKFAAVNDLSVCGSGDATTAPNDAPVPVNATSWGRVKTTYR